MWWFGQRRVAITRERGGQIGDESTGFADGMHAEGSKKKNENVY